MEKYPKPKGVVRIASFDPAQVNLGHYVDDTSINVIKSLKEEYLSLPKNLQRRCLGKMNSQVEEIQNKLFKSGKRVHMGVYNLKFNPDTNGLDMETRKNIVAHLRRFESLWDKCDIILVEKQYVNFSRKGKRNKANMTAIKIAEIIIGWFLDNYLTKEIQHFESRYKTQILGAPPDLKDKQRKTWAINKSLEIHALRGDQEVIDLYNLRETIKRKRMNSEEKIQSFTRGFVNHSKDISTIADQLVRYRQKFDDFSDACIQSQAYKFRTMIGGF